MSREAGRRGARRDDAAARGRDEPGVPTVFEATLPILTMVALLVAGAVTARLTAETLVAVLLIAATVAGGVARRHGASWEAVQRATGERIAAVLPALLILLAIGMLIGTWLLSGTIPFLVYWGVRLIDPALLVFTSFLATAAMSLATGTSWGSAGTIGVALMGTASALGAPLPATAGAIVSGAYLGDKMSPLSDSTNICAIGAGAPLYAHIRHMLYTATPSVLAAGAVYLLIARGSAAGDKGSAAGALLDDLERVYSLHWLVLAPIGVVVWGIARRTPPALAMAASSALACLLGVWQGFGAGDAVAAVVGGFRVSMTAAAGVDPRTVGPAFTALVERGGLYSMAPTLVVVFAAFLLAAAMEVSGSLDLLVRRLLATVHSVLGLIAATMAAGAVTIGLTSHGGVTALVIGGLFQRSYDERGLARVNLSRSLEDSVTIVEPLMPWTVSAVFMAATLGVPTAAYAPWAVFCYGGPLFSLLLAGLYPRTGFGLQEAVAAPQRRLRSQ
jgi:NhaC family Na+:H+ antiporter